MSDHEEVEPLEYECENCGATGQTSKFCRDCSWPHGEPVSDDPLCSICRSRHPSDDRHPCE